MQGCRGIPNWTLWFLPAIALSGVRQMVMRMEKVREGDRDSL